MKIKELKEMIKNAFIAEETNAEYFYEPMEEINANDSLNEVDDIDFVANLEAELAEGLYEAKYEDIDPETKEILNSLEGLRAKADDEKFETLLNTIVTMVRQYMYGDRKLNIGALKAAIEKGDFASLLKFQKTPNPGNPYMAEDLYEAEEEEQTDVTIDAKEKTTDGGEEKSSDDSIVVGKKIVKLSSLSDEKQDILNSLETLRAQAEEFGDGKFETQVGNTITFFNRDFVVGGDKPTKEKVDESLEILRMRKLAGLLTEGEYAKALLRENQTNLPSEDEIKEKGAVGDSVTVSKDGKNYDINYTVSSESDDEMSFGIYDSEEGEDAEQVEEFYTYKELVNWFNN